MSSKSLPPQQWYVRKGGKTRGPFADGQVTRDILLGRIRKHDEISTDREHWLSLGALPQLHPEVLKHTDTEQGRQHLLLARLREDQRQHERRSAAHANEALVIHSNRRHGDQRTVGSFDVVAHHASGTRTQDDEESSERNLLLPAAVIMITLFILTAYLLW